MRVMAKPLKGSEFKFMAPDRIGAAGAEEDVAYLRQCFVDTGNLAVLKDCSHPARIILGRTGAGKTALLLMLKEGEERVLMLEPSALSLQYLSNSTILQYLSNLGVDLNLFYRLLWRHIFAVELIRLRYNVDSEAAQQSFVERLRSLFASTSKSKEKALGYLMQWGEKFWEDSEVRVKDITTTLERKLRADAGIDIRAIQAQTSAHSDTSVTERKEVVKRLQDVVNSIQIAELGQVIQILRDDLLHEPQPRCYIVIDKLDEQWVDDSIRYRLIRALLETVKDFAVIKSGKIIVALRRDLIDRVTRLTRDAGFQEEKYEPLYLPIDWKAKDLLAVLDRRVQTLVSRRYTSGDVTYKNVLPPEIDGQAIDDYLVERTLYRPRDIILFFNACIRQAVDSPTITASKLKDAEAEYSELRLRSLQDEWVAEFPELLDLAIMVLRKKPRSFRVGEVSDDEIEEACLKIATAKPRSPARMHADCMDVMNDDVSPGDFRNMLFAIFYRVGLVGLKLETFTTMSWSFRTHTRIRKDEISDETGVTINPTFYRVLGVKP